MTQKNHISPKSDFCGFDGALKYAGIHLIIELWGAKHMDDESRIKQIMIESINAFGAKILSIDSHKFSPNGGVSGVAILQESHMSIHSWPEYKYAALDIFVCGSVNPSKVIPVIKKEFLPEKIQVTEIKRGIIDEY